MERNVILVGVHANMCVLGRPFGLRQMVRGGKQVVLEYDTQAREGKPVPNAARDPGPSAGNPREAPRTRS